MRDPEVYAAWDDNPLTADPTWTDISQYVREWSVRQSRDEVIGRFQAGTAQLLLDNRDRRFEPHYAAGAYFPNVKRRRGMKIVLPRYALDLPGTSGHNASTPAAAALDITVDIDIRVKVALDDWTPTATGVFISKDTAGAGGRSWSFDQLSNGALRFIASADGTNVNTNVSVPNPGLTNGTPKWLRVTFDADNGAAGRDIKFYLSDDGVVWTQTGATQTVAGTSSIANTATAVTIGDRAASPTPLAGLFHYAEVRNGIGGTVVASPAFDQPAGTTSFADAQGLPWTVNGASSAFVRTTDEPVYRGFIESIELDYPLVGKDAVARVTCADLTALLEGVKLQNPYVRAVMSDTPVAYYRLNDTGEVDSAGNIPAADTAGTGFGFYTTTGVTHQQPDAITDGADGAATFDGVTGFVASAVPVPIVNKMAVDAWFKSGSATFQRIADQQADGVVDFSLLLDSAGAVTFQFGQSSTSGIWQVTSSTGYADDAWHHVVGLVDVAAGDMFIWVDGVEDSVSTSTTGTPAAPSAATDWSIAVQDAANPQFFNGSLSDVAVYSGNHPDIAAHYAARNALLNDTAGERVTTVASYAGVPAPLLGADDGLSVLTSADNLETQSALAALRDVELTEAGAVFADRAGILTFRGRDAAWSAAGRAIQADLTGYTAIELSDPASDLANVVRNTRRNGTTHVARDDASATEHGESTLALSTVSSTAAEAQGRAAYDLARRSDPDQLRIQGLEFVLQEATFRPLVERELWDRVSVSLAPPGGGDPIEQEALVTGRAHSWKPGVWRMGLSLSALEARHYWVLDVAGWSELGETTRLSF